MRIVADKAIPLVREAFSSLGELEALPSSEILPSTVKDADILLIRTRTRIDKDLLDSSSVGFVASATAGTDHVDRQYLQEAEVEFYNSSGCNANAVAEYVFEALSWLSQKHRFSLSDKSIGIIGVGNVGSRVMQKAQMLAMQPLLNDPPKARESKNEDYVSLADALRADIVSFHVPLTETGPDRTRHLGNAASLGEMKPDSILINTSRGPVVDNQALKSLLEGQKIAAAVLDVWENEPDIDFELLRLVDFASPHVAGYSQEAKKNATRMIYEATCQYLKIRPDPSTMELFKSTKAGTIVIPSDIKDSLDALTYAFRYIYDIRRDDSEMRELLLGNLTRNVLPLLSKHRDDWRSPTPAGADLLGMDREQSGRRFEYLRNNYRFRRECSGFEVILEKGSPLSKEIFRKFGFL